MLKTQEWAERRALRHDIIAHATSSEKHWYWFLSWIAGTLFGLFIAAPIAVAVTFAEVHWTARIGFVAVVLVGAYFLIRAVNRHVRRFLAGTAWAQERMIAEDDIA